MTIAHSKGNYPMDLQDFLKLLKNGKIAIYIHTMHIQIGEQMPTVSTTCDPETCQDVVCAFWLRCKKLPVSNPTESED